MAANVVGAMITRWHYLSLAAPVVLLLFAWRTSRHRLLIVLFVAILFGSAQALVDTRIRALRNSSVTPISSLPRNNPVRRRFGLLHGVSSLLLLGEVVAAGVVVALRDES